jgi:hypothetical protein
VEGGRLKYTGFRFVVLLLLCASIGGCGGSKALTPRDNPHKNVQAGDWSKYRIVQQKNGSVVSDKEVKFLVTDASSEKYTLQSSSGDKQESREYSRAEYTPYDVPGLKTDIRELGTGTERLKVGDKEFECTWYEVELMPQGGGGKPWKYKEWISKEVPLTGKVKSELIGPDNRFEHSLLDYGRAK